MQGTNPKCRKLNLKDDKGRSGYYVADADIADLDLVYLEEEILFLK